jgi:dTDP-4-amino-4,6-dideoxygalactose transaminase
MTRLPLPSDQDASGRSLGDEEIALVREAILSGTLTATKGSHTRHLEEEFASLTGTAHVVACASGTAAVHVAVAAFDPTPGDEIVTTAITDMGAITPILYQGAIPVFADVDPVTGNLTAESVEAVISDRTRAIVLTHLFGNPADAIGIRRVADKHGIPLIEDCAQAYMASQAGVGVGRIGSIGCFSMQQGKHITSGEGGMVVTDDAALARRMRVFVNKAWPYGEPNPDHEFIALNYRITELQSAVARAQLAKLSHSVAQRIAMAERLTKQIDDIDGLTTPGPRPGDVHSYWRYALGVGHALGGPGSMAAGLKEHEIPSAPRYIQKPAFRCKVIAEQVTFGGSRWPFTLARPEAVDYAAERFPGTFAYLDTVLVLPWNEKLTDEHVDRLAASIRTVTTSAGE